MAQIIKEITVDVAKRNLFQAIVAKQHDSNSRFLKVTLINEGTTISVDTNSVVTINASRADGRASAFVGVVNADGTVTVPLTAWMLELDDLVKCDIAVVDSESRRLTSTSFELEVETAAYSGNEIMDDGNADLLLTLVSDYAQLKQRVENLEKNGSSGGNGSSNSSQNVDLTGYATEQFVQDGFQPKGDYLPSAELPNAVNSALAQAKESGEFDGKNGSNGLSILAVNITAGNAQKIVVSADNVIENGYMLSPRDILVGDKVLTEDGKIFIVDSWNFSVDTSGGSSMAYNATFFADAGSGIKSVNGVIPDENGNVEVEIPEGSSGVYYTPKVSFPGRNTVQFDFEPSVDGMPPVPSETITIPAGKNGVGIKSVVLNSDYTLTIRYDDDTSYTSESIRGEKGEQGDTGDTGPQGPKGDTGSNGVSVTHEWDGTVLKITSASGTSSANLKGEKGEKGEQGIQGPKGDQGKTGNDASVTATNIQNALGFTPANPSVLSLGIHTDGLVYLFVSGQPVGNGIELSATGDVIGYVDENNNIVVRGNLAEGTYSVKYEMDDGTTVDIGDLVVDNSVYYSVATNLTQCTNSNTATKVIGGQSYSTTIMANSGHEIKSVTVTMGGTDISSTAVSGGDISIAEVTGDIVITAVAEEIKAKYDNLAKYDSADWASGSRISSSGEVKKDTPGFVVTNYIGPVAKGQTIHIKGAQLLTGYNQGHYSSGKTPIANSASATLISQGQVVSADYDSSVTLYKNVGQYGNSVSSYNSWADNLVYVRLTIKPTGAESDIIITVNENIV